MPMTKHDEAMEDQKVAPKRRKLLLSAEECHGQRSPRSATLPVDGDLTKSPKSPSASPLIPTDSDDLAPESSDEEDEARPSGKLEFRITNISRFNDHDPSSSEVKLLSPAPTIIRCLPWRILFLLRNNPNPIATPTGSGSNKSLGFFLQCNGDSNSPSWHCHARAKLTIVAQKPGVENLTKHIDHTFFFKENDWGFSCFINWSDLMDPKRGSSIDCETNERQSLSDVELTESHNDVDAAAAGGGFYDTLVLQAHVYADAPHGVDWDSKRFTGFVGLRNQGATCYMNSLLQAFFFTNELRRAVFLMPTESDDASTSIPLALQRVFYELQFSNRAVGTKKLTRSFGWESLDSFMQHDAQELCRVLLDNMESKMKGTSVEDTIPNLFRGKMLSYIRCKHVPYESKREENFYDIQLKVKGNRTIYEAFEEYITVETLDGDNKYDAGEFGLQEAEKGVIFTQFPPVLYLQLMRFQYDCIANANVKVNDRFEFPYRLCLDRFLRHPEPSVYILHAVLVHSGDNHGGHYVAYINPRGDNTWYKFDDDVVSRSTRKEAINMNYGGTDSEHGYMFKHCTNAYMLVYIRRSALPTVLRPLSTADIPESLIGRLEEERLIEADHRRAKAESHLYTCVLLVLEEDFYGWQGFDLCDLDTLSTRRINVPKTASLNDLLQVVAAHLHERANRIRLWRVQPRRSGTIRVCAFNQPPRQHGLNQPQGRLPSAVDVQSEQDDPMAALTALANSYQTKSGFDSMNSTKVPRQPSGDLLIPSSGMLAVWVQTVSPEEPISTELSPFDSSCDILIFLKFFQPPSSPSFLPTPTPPEMSDCVSPLLHSLGTLNYVGWIIVRLDAPLRSLIPDLCRRALLPSLDVPLLLYEEIRVGELRRLKDFDNSIRNCFSDGPDAPILVYQLLPVSGSSKTIPELLHSGEIILTDELSGLSPGRDASHPAVGINSHGDVTFDAVAAASPATDSSRSNPVRPLDDDGRHHRPVKSPPNHDTNSLVPQRRSFERPHRRSKQTFFYNRLYRPFSKSLHLRDVTLRRAKNNLNLKSKRVFPAVNAACTPLALRKKTHLKHLRRPTHSINAQSCCQFVPYFFRELLSRVPVEFCELHFPWNLLTPVDSSTGYKQFAVVLPPKADNCLFPGIPFANRTSFASNALFATMSGKSPSFTVRLSLKNSCRHLLHLLASHLNTEPQFIQLFKPLYLGSGDKEFVAIPSAFLGTLQGLLSVAGSASSCNLHHNHHTSALGELGNRPFTACLQRSPASVQRKAAPTPLVGGLFQQNSVPRLPPSGGYHRSLHSATSPSSSAMQLYYQRLPMPLQAVENLCQLRCVFVDSLRVRDVARLTLVVPRTSTVREILNIARLELEKAGILSSSPAEQHRQSHDELLPPGQVGKTRASSEEQTVEPLRLLETLNSWILQQYAPERLASSLQLLDNRLLRIEVVPVEERSTHFGGLTTPPSRYETADSAQLPSAEVITKAAQALASTPNSEDQLRLSVHEVSNDEDISRLLSPPVDNLGNLKIISSPEGDRTSDSTFPDGLVLSQTTPPFPPTYSTSPRLKDVCTPAADEEASSELQQFVTVAKKPTKPPPTIATGDRMPKFQVNYRKTTRQSLAPAYGAALETEKAQGEEEAVEPGNDDENKCPCASPLSLSPLILRAPLVKQSSPASPHPLRPVAKSLVVACGHFFRGDPNYGGFGNPFTFVLHHGERVSYLLERIRRRLGASPQEAEKWRLAVLPGPIPAAASHVGLERLLEPLVPTQESLLMMMRPTYLPSDRNSCVNLSVFLTPMLANLLSRENATNYGPVDSESSELARLLLLFGMRPWLGIEHKIPPKRPRCVLSEKPIRILN
ncbi:hypothetical protein AAHC03_05089 [Spirometra sp. Aus1]